MVGPIGIQIATKVVPKLAKKVSTKNFSREALKVAKQKAEETALKGIKFTKLYSKEEIQKVKEEMANWAHLKSGSYKVIRDKMGQITSLKKQ